MEVWIYSNIFTAILTFLQINHSVEAYYRCEWVSTGHGNPISVPQDNKTQVKTRECYYKDSDIMSSFVSRCTHHARFIRTCSDNGQWDCNSFIGFCKTLIKVEPTTSSNSIGGSSGKGTVLPLTTGCTPSRTHFSLQEMSLAVLVSFISGSIILSAMVVLVWKCRHAKWESQQSKIERRQKEQRTAALHAITQIARVLGAPNNTTSDADTVFYLNPAYSKTVASDIIDIISENDHIYEEVMLRRMSSCLARSAPVTPGNSKRKHTIAKSNSLNSIMEIAENLERLEKGMGSADTIPTGTEPKVDDGRIEIEVPSTSDSGYMEDVRK